ncbi:MAG: hypothetical protein EBX52_03310 [Proteobacteria bacterium]|nr:hypothetical protein [Pseudomonadota bacterium]
MKRLVSEGSVAHLDAVIADEQTLGRGRHGRQWSGLRGNLHTSIYLEPQRLPLTWIPHWVGVTALESLRELGLAPKGLRLKWPNDLVFLDETGGVATDGLGAKMGGILCETAGSGVTAGIGINLLHVPDITGREVTSLVRVLEGIGSSRTTPRSEPTLPATPTGSREHPLPLPSNLAYTLLEKILEHLSIEPTRETLRIQYEKWTLIRKGDAVSWTDLQSGIRGAGRVQDLGEHGELLVETRESGIPVIRPLFSEEISGLGMDR